MKVVINDEYKNCKELVVFLESLDTRYRQKGRTLHLDRNGVRSFAISELGRDIVIKRYKKPLSVQRVVYSFFRKSKAERAYYNGLKLLELGIDTPTPIAYVEQKKTGLMEYCYFACEKTSYKSLEPLILLDRPLDAILPTSDRPLALTAEDLKKRYNERYDIYLESCDERICADCDVRDVVKKIEGSFGK